MAGITKILLLLCMISIVHGNVVVQINQEVKSDNCCGSCCPCNSCDKCSPLECESEDGRDGRCSDDEVEGSENIGKQQCNGDCNCWVPTLTTDDFETFKSRFDKEFTNADEEEKRRSIFYENLRTIHEHNIMYESGKSSFKMGINELSDMTYDEVINTMTGIKGKTVHRRHIDNCKDANYTKYSPVNVGYEPASINYVTLGHLNPIRNQGACNCTQQNCGSCWAFSTIATLESHISLAYSTLIRLSAQDLVSCDNTNGGCNGGWPDIAMEWVKTNGIALEIGYHYMSGIINYGAGVCYNSTPETSYSVKSIQQVSYKNDRDLYNAVAFSGPVSVCIVASPSFKDYKTGVFDGTGCTAGASVNHAVVVVGYGTEAGQPYWLVRNSWGTTWGENGYIKMARNVDNICGISTCSFIPLVTAPTGYKNHTEIWYDWQCPVIGVAFGKTVAECETFCDTKTGCTAFDYSPWACVLRQCYYPVPQPQWVYQDYVGYSKI